MENARPFEPYVPPEWCRGLKCIPERRVRLAQVPTPLHKWNLPGVKDDFEVFIKREDMAGAALSGNKIRKMEFMLAEALDKGCDCVVTVGSLQSNHARVTAVAARQLGMDSHLLLLTDTDKKPEDFPVLGNALLDRLVGAHVYIMKVDFGDTTLFGKLQTSMLGICDKLRSQNKNPYLVKVGGAGITGLWAYIDAFQEMIEQGILDKVDDIFLPVSTGGTALGLAVGSYLNGSKIKVHAVLVGGSAPEVYDQMNEELKELCLLDNEGELLKAKDLVDLVIGYMGSYSVTTPEEKALLCKISTTTGIILDTTFTLKAVNGMLSEMEKNPGRFKGRRVLFIHTGGLFGIMNGVLSETLLATEETNRVHRLSDIIGPQ